MYFKYKKSALTALFFLISSCISFCRGT